MNTQLKSNTNISTLFLKDNVINKDVAEYLSEINKDSQELQKIEHILRGNIELGIKQKKLLIEILKNVMKLFRTQGGKSPGLTQYIEALKN